MASVVRDAEGRSPFWYACYTDANGRRLKKSTGLTAKSKALEMARSLEKAWREAKNGGFNESRARELLGEILQSATGQTMRVFSVRQWFDHFCKIKVDRLDPDTSAKYEQIKREFLEFLDQKADKNILAITSEDVRAFRDDRKKGGLSATTLNDHVTVLSSYFNGALLDHVIKSNPCTAVESMKDNVSRAKRRKQPFTVEQVKALLDKATPDWRGLINIAFYSGARLENCANLRFRDLDFNSEPPVIVFENYSKHDDDEHRVPMHPTLRDHLLSIMKKRGQLRKTGKIIQLPTAKGDGDSLFPSLAGRRVTNLSKQFRKLMAAAGIENRKVREAGNGAARDVWSLGFHSFRRTNVSILANAGVPEERRMKITAHATRDVHAGYTHHELSRLYDDIAKALPAL